MARQKKKPDDEESMPAAAPRPVRSGKQINFRAEDELYAAFKAYVSSLRPKPSVTAVAKVAFEEFLERHGFWPPVEPPAE